MRIGIDQQELDPVAAALERHGAGYLSRIFTSGEVEATTTMSAARRVEFLAGRFAGKEAVFKALRLPGPEWVWTEIEIVRDEQGAPEVRLHGRVAEWAASHGIGEIAVSITHTATVATAIAAVGD